MDLVVVLELDEQQFVLATFFELLSRPHVTQGFHQVAGNILVQLDDALPLTGFILPGHNTQLGLQFNTS